MEDVSPVLGSRDPFFNFTPVIRNDWNDFEWPSKPFTYCKPLEMRFFVVVKKQLTDFNGHRTLHGFSVIAQHLVFLQVFSNEIMMTVSILTHLTWLPVEIYLYLYICWYHWSLMSSICIIHSLSVIGSQNLCLTSWFFALLWYVIFWQAEDSAYVLSCIFKLFGMLPLLLFCHYVYYTCSNYVNKFCNIVALLLLARPMGPYCFACGHLSSSIVVVVI